MTFVVRMKSRPCFNLPMQDKFGGVDVCVNNAGLAHDAPLFSGETESWREMLEVRLKLRFLLVKLLFVLLLLFNFFECYFFNVCIKFIL